MGKSGLRRKVNQIVKIKDVDEREWGKQEEIDQAFVNFYQNLFTARDTSGVDECSEALEPHVTDEMNSMLMLLRKFTVMEVEAALNQMHLLKSSGPNGFAACFYHNSWPTVYKEVCHAVLGFLNNDVFDVGIFFKEKKN
jgi:hypothetical protein